jgi:carbamoyltransferase
LCLSGGCAYNGTANGKIQNETSFQNIWIPPAPSDAGSAIGAALYVYYHCNPNSERIDNTSPFLGPSEKILDVVKVCKQNEKQIYFEALSEKHLLPKVAKLISEGNIIGWVQSKLEFGARALGNRSILADPRDPQMKQRVNSVVKKREGFRPFAPMCTFTDMGRFFTPNIEIPYMNQIVKVKKPHRSKLPAITHIDGSARVQTLKKNMNPKMFDLLKEYEKITKYPILLNTSFNLKDQTMVRNSQEAIDTFMKCDLDYLVIDNLFISKKII